MRPEKMRSVHIETNQYHATSAHQERQIDGLEAGILAVMNPGRIERKTGLVPPLNQAQPVLRTDRRFVVTNAPADMMARPALTLEFCRALPLPPPCGVAAVKHICPGQQPIGILNDNDPLSAADLDNVRRQRRPRSRDDHHPALPAQRHTLADRPVKQEQDPDIDAECSSHPVSTDPRLAYRTAHSARSARPP